MATEDYIWADIMASQHLLYRSLRQWHGTRWDLCELGRSAKLFSKKLREYVETSQKRRGLTDGLAEVGLTDSTRSLGKPGTGGSGQRRDDRLRGLLD
jgi:hypothetical protein